MLTHENGPTLTVQESYNVDPGQTINMGCGASRVDPEAREAAALNEKIEKQLRQDNKTDQKTVKILLLG